jgi:hypothetical protein
MSADRHLATVGKIGEGQERTDGLEIAAELTPEHLK